MRLQPPIWPAWLWFDLTSQCARSEAAARRAHATATGVGRHSLTDDCHDRAWRGASLPVFLARGAGGVSLELAASEAYGHTFTTLTFVS